MIGTSSKIKTFRMEFLSRLSPKMDIDSFQIGFEDKLKPKRE